MNNKHGQIISHVTYNSLTGKQETITNTWEGGDRVSISWELLGIEPNKLKIGDKIKLFPPFVLRVVGYGGFGYSDCIRDRGFITDVIVFIYKYTRILDLIYRRAIITLCVWRLARYQQAAVPTWRDVHALRWIAEKIGDRKRNG